MSQLLQRILHWSNSSLLRNISKVYFGDVLSKVIAVGSMILLIRQLDVSGYAQYTTFTSLSTLTAGIVGGGVNLALVRFSAEYYSRTGERPLGLYLVSIFIELTLLLLLFLVTVLLYEELNALFFNRFLSKGIIKYGIAAGFGLLLIQVGRSVLQAEERFNFYVGTLFLKQLLTLIVL